MSDENQQNAGFWPLDYESLRKGDVIGAATLESIASTSTGKTVVRGTDDYNLSSLRLITMIEARRPELRVRRSGHDLRILSDSEYANDNRRRTRSAVRKMLRTAALPTPDLNALTQEDRQRWDTEQARSLRHAESVALRERELRAERAMLVAGARRPLRGA